MKKFFVISVGLGIAVFSGVADVEPLPDAPLAAGERDAPAAGPAHSLFDSTLLITTGVVGAGGDEPVLARTNGRVQGLFFAGGDYARRGQLLAKLSNHSFITAPQAGFLGPNQLTIGQYVLHNTLVTTLSRRSYLVVSLLLPHDWQSSIKPGDSVRVWAATLPHRVGTGVVGPFQMQALDDVLVEIILSSRAPFRIGEPAYVQLQDTRHLLATRRFL